MYVFMNVCVLDLYFIPMWQPGLYEVDFDTVDEHEWPLLVDNPIVSLTGNFAVTAFNEAIEMV